MKNYRSDEFSRHMKGFSLVELLVTVAITSIMAGLAVSQYQEYRRNANDLVAITSLYNARTGINARFADSTQQSIFSFMYDTDLTTHNYGGDIPGYTHTENVRLVSCSSTAGVYFITTYNNKGTYRTAPSALRAARAQTYFHTYRFSSVTGVIQTGYPMPAVEICIYPATPPSP